MAERKLLIEVDDKSGLDSFRNRTFPGWWTYGAEVLPDHSPLLLQVRHSLYPAWHTTLHNNNSPAELKSLYVIRSRSPEETALALLVQPRNIRVCILEEIENPVQAQQLAEKLNGIEGVRSKLISIK